MMLYVKCIINIYNNNYIYLLKSQIYIKYNTHIFVAIADTNGRLNES